MVTNLSICILYRSDCWWCFFFVDESQPTKNNGIKARKLLPDLGACNWKENGRIETQGTDAYILFKKTHVQGERI
jgi:hypothetical protein